MLHFGAGKLLIIDYKIIDITLKVNNISNILLFLIKKR